ncbi:hypothetical protein CerSpe_195030 [Prunus speciosa]
MEPTISAPSFSSDGFVLSVLELLPAAILAPALVLSLEDRQVLAYLITRSMKTIPNISSIPTQDPEKKSSKKGPKSTSPKYSIATASIATEATGSNGTLPPTASPSTKPSKPSKITWPTTRRPRRTAAEARVETS